MEFQIQPVEPTHIEEFLDICAELSAFDGNAPFDREQALPAAKQLLENPHRGQAVWLLANGKRAGYLVVCFGWSFEFGGRTGILEHLYVREPFRRQGAATAGLRWVETLCKSEDIVCLYLGVDTSNENAQNFYRKCGFQNSDLLFWMKQL